ncbi:hypothetical protein GWK08_04720 [Leptobacterium flavescens]|uniref:Uncharacterized protein n=1 Tax=Leptobacterium flavescens TaxID=472055 RepID=A0A6P0UP92_9FLAO|nr:hypothetical protein [Leptobacterium flavescens]NER12733.1 hypothetical protein [Leptobacterium flavescens]
MKVFFKFISYLFHPLFLPLAGAVIYYTISPKFHPPEEWQSVILRVSILTLLIPIVFFYLLRNIGWVSSIYLKEVSERKIPLYIYIFLIFMVIYGVVSPIFALELYFYFVGILGSLIACLVLVFFRFKASMHMMGISGLTLFVIGLSFHYEVNITFALALLVFSIGLVASSRLYLKAHDNKELLLGFFIGAVPQFIVFNNWL